MRPAKRIFLVFALLSSISGAAWSLSFQQEQKPQASIRAEFGIDSSERRYIRPEFRFAWPLAFSSGSRAFMRLSYIQRINGRLQGPIDYWADAGFSQSLTDTVALEAGLNHFCRHELSTENPYILNFNELTGRLWFRPGPIEIGLGFGRFVGGSPGFRNLAVFDMNIPRLLRSGFSIEAAFKWVNYREIYYEAGITADLAEGASVLIRAARHYGLPSAAYLGFRFSSEGAARKFLDRFDLSAGVYPLYDTHKMLTGGGFRFGLMNESGRRFFVDLAFDAPILSGSGFFNQFWPDRMLYTAAAEYEHRIGSLFAAWYARYFVDMPADKNMRPSSSLSTGIALRNQSDFDRLERRVRFEADVGYDFKYDYDARLKLGINTVTAGPLNAGAEFRGQASRPRKSIEFKIFADFGRDFAVRPFLGIKKVSYEAGGPPAREPLKRMLTFGVSFYRWY